MSPKQDSTVGGTGREELEHGESSVSRRSTLKGIAGAGLLGLVGIPAMSGSAAAQSPALTKTWHDQYTKGTNSQFQRVIATSDGNALAVGHGQTSTGDIPVAAKYDGSGRMWLNEYSLSDLTNGNNHLFNAKGAAEFNGGYAIVVDHRLNGQDQTAVLYTDAAGNRTDYRTYPSVGPWPKNIIATSDGGLLALPHGGLLKLDANGDVEWTASNGALNMAAVEVADGYLISGGKQIRHAFNDAYIGKFGLNGSLTWHRQHSISSGSENFNTMTLLGNGTLAVAGNSDIGGVGRMPNRAILDPSDGSLVSSWVGSTQGAYWGGPDLPNSEAGAYSAGYTIDGPVKGLVTKVAADGTEEFSHAEPPWESSLQFGDFVEAPNGLFAVGNTRSSVISGAVVCFEGANSQIELSIDVKPGNGDETDPINPNAKGNIPVAVYSTPDFDATTLDVSSLAFGPGGASAAHDGHVEDVDDDGLPDLLLHFPVEEAGFTDGDTEAELVGQTGDGTDAVGTDTVRIVGGKGRGNGRGR